MDFQSFDGTSLTSGTLNSTDVQDDCSNNVTFQNGTTSQAPKPSSSSSTNDADEIISVEQEDDQLEDEARVRTPIPPPRPSSALRPATASQAQRLTLGIIILILVDIIWVASSELTEYIFHDEQYNKPFFSSYLKTSMFLIFLSGFIFWTPWHDQCMLDYGGRNSIHQHAYTLLESEEFQTTTATTSNIASTPITHEVIDNNANESSLSPPSYVPVIYDANSGYETDDSSQHRSVRFSKIAEVRHLADAEANDALFARLSYQASVQAEELAKRLANRMSLNQTAQLALTFCLMWFIAAYTYQLSISHTEAGIVNLLSSSSSLFTLVLAAIFPSNAGDKFTLSKFLAVLCSFGGVMIVTLSDVQLEDRTVPLGAVFALISALFYACYLVFLRRKVDHEDKLDILMFFGFVGLFNLILLWPLFFLLNYFSIETFELPTHKQWLYLILNGFIGTVFSEVLWLWGCFLTSSLIATLAVSLTIPLSMLADVLLKQISYSHLFYLGSIPMVLSFFAVTLLSHYQNWDPILGCCKSLKRRILHSRRRDRYQGILDIDSQRESLIGNSFEDYQGRGDDETDEEENLRPDDNNTINGANHSVLTSNTSFQAATEIL